MAFLFYFGRRADCLQKMQRNMSSSEEVPVQLVSRPESKQLVFHKIYLICDKYEKMQVSSIRHVSKHNYQAPELHLPA